MTESGQISRLWSRWKSQPRQDCFDQGTVALGITNLFTAFLMMGFAFVIALAAGLIEYFVFKKFRRDKKKSEEDNSANLKASMDSKDPATFYENKNAVTKSALAKEWFEFAFNQNPK